MKRVFLILFFLICVIVYTFSLSKETNEFKLQNDSLAILLQQENGTYELSTNNIWPTEGYEFKKSECDNEADLVWQDNALVLNTISSNRCKLYFDIKKDEPLTITSANVSIDYDPCPTIIYIDDVEFNKKVAIDKYIVVFKNDNYSDTFTYEFNNIGNEYSLYVQQNKEGTTNCLDGIIFKNARYTLHAISSDGETSNYFEDASKVGKVTGTAKYCYRAYTCAT